MNTRRFVILGFVLALALVAVFSRCSSPPEIQETKAYLNHNDTVKYVGSDACKTCHYVIYESYAKTGMGQSFGPANKQKSSGKFEHNVLYDSFSNFHYQPFWKGDSLYLKEFRIENGDTIYKRIERADYIVGSGHHTNSHIQNTNGYLHQLPFTYYTQNDTLSLPPGFESGNNSRYNRALGMECLSCHNGLPDHVSGSMNKYEKVPFGIDCERCHGPGEAHVNLKKQGVMVDVLREIDYSIVNPAKLEYAEQKDLCQRCHLQGNAILKEDKSWEDFKPGMRLTDVYDVFMPMLKDQEGDFIMAAHPDRLRQSACFIESAKDENMKSMTCITCHNPHQSVLETKMAYFNSKCQDCHRGTNTQKCTVEPNSDQCISCHMKKSGTVDIPHVSVTDHYIRVYKGKDNLESAGETDPQDFIGLVCLTNNKPSKALQAQAYLNFYEKFDPNPLFLDTALSYLKQVPKRESESAWIQYYFLTKNEKALREIYSSLQNIDAFSAQTLYRLSTAFNAPNELKFNTQLLEKAVAKASLRLDLRNKLSVNYLRQNDLLRAKAQIDFVISEFSKNEEALNNRGFYFLIKGDLTSAERDFNKVLKLNPDHTNAMLNLAKINLAKSKNVEAIEYLKKALRINPDFYEAKLLKSKIEASK
ncbi:MAG: tetratricopeptide repeat protein [Bacteroidia bacterium]